jgi:formiminoglutamase
LFIFVTMDITVFFRPSPYHSADAEEFHPASLWQQTTFFSGDLEQLEGKKLALIGVKEDRNSSLNIGCSNGPDEVRKHLYNLFRLDSSMHLIDLGNIEPGNEVEDTYFAVKETCGYLLKMGIMPILLGGSQDLTYANYLAYEKLEQTVNLVTIDYRLDFGTAPEDGSSKGYLNKIVLHKPNYLFNYSNVGGQRYLTDPDLLELMNKMYFDALRLGEVQPNMPLAEPTLRNADLISFDIGAIRQSEAPGSAHCGPNGFYGDQAAQICRYAGMSDKLTSFGIYEYNPAFDINGQTAHLIAQMVWCFFEGFVSRKSDFPIGDYSEYSRYIVHLTGDSHELVFYKSHKSDRWWMDVPYPAGATQKYERHHLVPCTYAEYQQATNEEMPDRWWKTYQKLV